jgi:hypothetical protein
MTSSVVIATVPRVPTTRRTMCEACSRNGMKSISVTSPSSVVKVVSRISVVGRYRRLIRAFACAGAMRQRPFLLFPSSAAKQASESKRGQQSQSMEPSLETSAAVSQSPMSP